MGLLTERQLRQLVREIILAERATLPAGVDLYHRSTKTFKVGDIIDGSFASKHREQMFWEEVIEAYRVDQAQKDWKRENIKPKPKTRSKKKVETPDPVMPETFSKPLSRMGAVFASLVPRSRFHTYGNLYRVKLIDDNYRIADSMLIDKIQERISQWESNHYDFGRPSVEDAVMDNGWEISRYFDEVKITKANLENIEVYAPRMQVVEVIDEKSRIKPGDVYETNAPQRIRYAAWVNDEKKQKMIDAGYDISEYLMTIPANEKFKIVSFSLNDNKFENSKDIIKSLKISPLKFPDVGIQVLGNEDEIYRKIKSGIFKKVE